MRAAFQQALENPVYALATSDKPPPFVEALSVAYLARDRHRSYARRR